MSIHGVIPDRIEEMALRSGTFWQQSVYISSRTALGL
jgi:hypothetical protein